MNFSKFVRLAVVMGLCIGILVVFAAPLPGEFSGSGCSGAQQEESVDFVQYCKERCALKAWKEVTECGFFPDKTEQDIYNMCYSSMNCDAPSICEPKCLETNSEKCPEGTFWKPFVSTDEAKDCLNALEKQDCNSWGTIPDECKDSIICDP